MPRAVASASEYAHRGLDKLEENLPILQQQTEKVTELRHQEPLGAGGSAGWGASGALESVVPPLPLLE